MKRIELELGEEATVTAEGVEGEDNRWHVTGNAVVVDSAGAGDGDIMDDPSLKVVAAQVGVSQFSFGPDIGVIATDQERFAGRSAKPGEFFTARIEVVAKGQKGKAAAVNSPLVTSGMFNGLVPMEEVQDGPSEATPYGMDQFNKPVMPAPVMTNQDPETATVARASEDAEATGLTGIPKASPGEGETGEASAEEAGDDSATEAKGRLPEDFPGHAALAEAGYTSYGKLRGLKGDYTSVPGVGDATAAKIKEALGEE